MIIYILKRKINKNVDYMIDKLFLQIIINYTRINPLL